LQREDKFRYIGVSNFGVSQMRRAQAIASITFRCYRRTQSSPVKSRKTFSPKSAGLLTGAMTKERVASFAAEDWRRNLPNFQEPLLSGNLKLVERWREIGDRHGRSPGEVAIAWTLDNPAVTGAIVGFQSAQQASQVVGAAEFKLLPADTAEIEEALTRESAA